VELPQTVNHAKPTMDNDAHYKSKRGEQWGEIRHKQPINI